MAKATFELRGVYPTWLTRTSGAASLAAAAPPAGTAIARPAVVASAATRASQLDLAYLIADLRWPRQPTTSPKATRHARPRRAVPQTGATVPAVSTLFRKVTKQY